MHQQWKRSAAHCQRKPITVFFITKSHLRWSHRLPMSKITAMGANSTASSIARTFIWNGFCLFLRRSADWTKWMQNNIRLFCCHSNESECMARKNNYQESNVIVSSCASNLIAMSSVLSQHTRHFQSFYANFLKKSWFIQINSSRGKWFNSLPNDNLDQF